MGQSLQDIAQQLKDSSKKVQLIYAFNGTGKTRLSREFKNLIAPKHNEDDEPSTQKKIIYYNAFTEDLFYWDNDLIGDTEPKLKIQTNSFIDWIVGERGAEPNIAKNFQCFVNSKLTPTFKEEDIISQGKKTGKKTYPEVFFSLDMGTERTANIKMGNCQIRSELVQINADNLKEEAARRYILTSLKRGYASENGQELNDILPKMSPLNPQYLTKKQNVFQKIAAFVEKFKGVGGEI